MSKCDHGLTARLPVCALCADELEISRDEWEKRWREEAVRNTQLRRELAEEQARHAETLQYNADMGTALTECRRQLALARQWIDSLVWNGHKTDCPKISNSAFPCTCGRDALLKALEVPRG